MPRTPRDYYNEYMDQIKDGLYNDFKLQNINDTATASCQFRTDYDLKEALLNFCQRNPDDEPVSRIPSMYVLGRFLIALDHLDVSIDELNTIVNRLTDQVKHYKKVDVTEEVDLELP